MTIRIAPGPPTEAGWYWLRMPGTTDSRWKIVEVGRLVSGVLCVHGLLATIPYLSKIPCQWSTRIPDPEEPSGE